MRHHPQHWPVLLPLISALLAAPALASPEPHAGPQLFVSQGCSACRPANELMTELSRDPGLRRGQPPRELLGLPGVEGHPGRSTVHNPAEGIRAHPEQSSGLHARDDRQRHPGLASVPRRTRSPKRSRRPPPGRTPLPVPVEVWEEGGMIIVDIGAGTGEATAWLLPVLRSGQVPIDVGRMRAAPKRT